MGEIVPRWLRPEDAARHIGRNRDELRRLVRAGKIPAPSYHFGPRSPRYDREAIDVMICGGADRIRNVVNDEEVSRAIIERANRKKASGRRKH